MRPNVQPSIPMLSSALHLGLIGCGSIGQRHARNALSLGCSLSIYDPAPQAITLPAGDWRHSATLADLISANPDAYLIAAPNHLHGEMLTRVLPTGKPIFVEKPVLISMDDKQLTAAIADAGDRITLGYNIPHRLELQAWKQIQPTLKGKPLHLRVVCSSHLPSWRTSDYRLSYSAHTSQGGGVIFDAIHEINYVRYFFGEPSTVYCHSKKISDLELSAEDSADIILGFPSGFTANLHLDYFQRNYQRGFHFATSEETVIWDFNAKSLTIIRPQTDPEIHTFPNTDGNSMYIDELRHFIAVCRGEATPLANGADGLRDLEIALCAKQSQASARRLDLPPFRQAGEKG